jgi:hypothetical protein
MENTGRYSGLGVSSNKMKYIVYGNVHYKNARQKHNINPFELSVLYPEEIKSRLNTESACYHSVHNVHLPP